MFTSWEDSSSPPGIIQFVGTREVVQDYESIRAALGYDKINFLGCSYGSFRAAGYAAKYPRRVGNFALDSVVPHGQVALITPLISHFGLSLSQPNIIQARDQIKMATRSLLRADAFCQNNASCPFHSAGKGSVPAVSDRRLFLRIKHSTDILSGIRDHPRASCEWNSPQLCQQEEVMRTITKHI